MSSEIVDIGLRVDSSSVKDGERALDDLGSQAEKTQKATDALSLSAKLFGGAIALATTAIAGLAVKLLHDAIPAALESEKSMNRLSGVLKATGNAAGLSANQIEDFVQALTSSTHFDDESIRNAAASLAVFQNIQGETFKEALRLGADYASLYGGDVSSAVYMFGRALDSPLEGQAALTRQGIRLSEAQQKLIKDFEAVGDRASAQGVLLDALKGKFDGVAQTMNTGLNKATSDLKKAWDELAETIGGKLSNSFITLASSATSALNAMKSFFTSGDFISDPLEFMASSVDKLREKLDKEIQNRTDKANGIFGLSAKEEAESNARIERIKMEMVKAATEVNDYVKRLKASGIQTEEDAAKLGAANATARRDAEFKKAASDKLEESSLQVRSKAANDLKEIYDKMYDDVLTPQDKFFNKLKEIGQVEKVYGKTDITRAALDAASNELRSGTMALPETQAGIAADNASKAIDDARNRELDRLNDNLRTQEESIRESYDRRQFMVEDAFQRGLIGQETYNSLSTELWAQSEAEKSIILADNIASREAIDRAHRDNDLSLTANFFGAISALLGTQGKKTFEASKALSLAEAIVKTYSATIKAYESQLTADPTSPFRAVAAGAAAAAFGLAQIAKISATHYGSSSASGSSASAGAGGGSSAPQQPPQQPVAQPGSGNKTRGGVTNITFVGDKNGTVTLDADQMDALAQQMRDAVDRGDMILINPLSYNGQLLAGAR